MSVMMNGEEEPTVKYDDFSGKEIAVLCRMLIHLSSYDDNIREHLLDIKCTETLIGIPCLFSGDSSVIFTFLQHQCDSLFKLITNEIESCLLKIQNKDSSMASEVTLHNLLDGIAPLINRNQSICIDFINKNLLFKQEGGHSIVEWNPSSCNLALADPKRNSLVNTSISFESRDLCRLHSIPLIP
jgi:hypothetical protein